MAEVEIEGLRQLQAKTEQMVADLQGGPLLEAMKQSTLLVERGAKQRAPVDTGRLRASVTPSVTQRPLEGVVGSNVVYAPYQELGFTSRGGRWIEGKRFLRGALEAAKDKIKALFEEAVKRIVEKK